MTADLTWLENNIPVSRRFDDMYFSKQGGRDEARHVFLRGNGLPGRWRDSDEFTIAELGFGTGLNFLETASAWRKTANPSAALTFVSFELFPVSLDDIRRTIACWPDLAPVCEELCAKLHYRAGWNSFEFGAVRLHLAVGDANELVRDWAGCADAWFLDGFSPRKNPELWGENLLRQVYRKTSRGGTFSTYTAAGWVRRNLQNAGFQVRKTPGFGRKRDMASGVKNPSASGVAASRGVR